ncbi:MAG TPA: large conductance mechanosensitive channel protein MscL [Jatrophihabitantaceae bacterium]|jgi:large conductance mechanosensitive channel
MLKGFKEFILRGNVVDLAVAVVIGAAFGAVVNSLVKDILTPLIAAIVGQHDFSVLEFTIHKSTFRYGDLINSLISFLLIAIAIYFFVVVPMNALAERRAHRIAAGERADEERQAKPDEVVVLEQIRDLLSAQRSA